MNGDAPIELEPGQRLVLIKYGNFYDLVANAYAGRLLTVGSELVFLRRQGAYILVRNGYGEEGLLMLTSVSAADPRHYFTSATPALRGFLVDGMYDDTSGGSLDSLTLEGVDALGTVVLDARYVVAIQARAETLVVHTADGAAYRGKATRLWLVTSTMRINLAKARALDLVRAAPA